VSEKRLRVVVHIDGGARGNPGPAAAGVVVACADGGGVLRQAGIFLGRATNNVAEYRGLIEGLRLAATLNAEEVQVVSDSQLLVYQMTGRYRVKNEGLKPLHREAGELALKFRKCLYRHVPREENVLADRLVNRAIDQRRDVGGSDTPPT
jgi:ribonuclease HI